MTDETPSGVAAAGGPPHPPPAAWWERLLGRLLPDNKGWLSIAATGVIFFLLNMIRENPALLANASFMQFAGVLGGGSFLVLYAHFFGGTKTGSDMMTAQRRKSAGQGGDGIG